MRRSLGGRGEKIPNTEALLESMRRCRDTLITAQSGVKPFGVMYHACNMVTAAIDALAYLLTGQPHFYSVGSSVAPAGDPHIARAPKSDL